MAPGAAACAWMVEVDCSLVHDLARSARRAEIAEVIDAWSAGVTGRLSTIARVARKAEIAEVSTKRISPNRDQTNDARTSRARPTSRLLLAAPRDARRAPTGT